jgi:DNA processing protein
MSPRFELSIDDARYPAHLRLTPEPPEILYGIGDLSCLVPGIAVIGARKGTPYGLSAASLFARWAAEAGYLVISGGAIGCDQAAHFAARDAEASTVAVLGCGADVDYPSNAVSLLADIRRTGAVLSELPWGAPPQRWAFRRRNRIIAGLSAGVLVVEAALPSGTFSTADYALDAGREVLAVPGSIFAPECAGSNRLIRQGATPVTDVSEFALELERLLGRARLDVATERPSPLIQGGSDIASALIASPMRPDDIARAFGLDIVAVARRLGVLESQGRIARYPDGRYGVAGVTSSEGARRRGGTIRENSTGNHEGHA